MNILKSTFLLHIYHVYRKRDRKRQYFQKVKINENYVKRSADGIIMINICFRNIKTLYWGQHNFVSVSIICLQYNNKQTIHCYTGKMNFIFNSKVLFLNFTGTWAVFSNVLKWGTKAVYISCQLNSLIKTHVWEER